MVSFCTALLPLLLHPGAAQLYQPSASQCLLLYQCARVHTFVFILIFLFGQKISGLADRHLVLFVGEQEVCRGGVPAPAPPTEGSSWAYDLWSSDSAAAAAAGDGGDGGKGRSGRGGGREVRDSSGSTYLCCCAICA